MRRVEIIPVLIVATCLWVYIVHPDLARHLPAPHAQRPSHSVHSWGCRDATCGNHTRSHRRDVPLGLHRPPRLGEAPPGAPRPAPQPLPPPARPLPGPCRAGDPRFARAWGHAPANARRAPTGGAWERAAALRAGGAVLWVCDGGCGGLGDRYKGLMSAFLLALLTNRTFGLLHGRPARLSAYLPPAWVPWERAAEGARIDWLLYRTARLVDDPPPAGVDFVQLRYPFVRLVCPRPRAPFNNSAPQGLGGGWGWRGVPPHPPHPLGPPPLQDWAKFSSRPSADQKFSLAPSAPIKTPTPPP